MNKREFVILLRAVIRKEMKPIVEEVVQSEFRLLRESMVVSQKPVRKSRELLSEDISIENLMEEGLLLKDVLAQEAQDVEIPKKRKLFKNSNVFTNMLQQTIDEGYKIGTIQREVPAGGGQNLVQIGNPSPNRADMLDAIGYGELSSEGAVDTPGTQIIQVPQATPDGKPINPKNIPAFLLQAMNKDYSKDLKELKKADNRRHGE